MDIALDPILGAGYERLSSDHTLKPFYSEIEICTRMEITGIPHNPPESCGDGS